MPLNPSSSPRVRAAFFALLVLVVTGCSAPADTSEEYRVLVSVGAPLVYRGDGTYAYAQLYHLAGTDTTLVPNAVLAWSGGGNVATITSYPNGYANIDGIARGTAYINIVAPAYGEGTIAYFSIRVADEVELDSVRPDTVAWGQRLTLYGVRAGDPNNVSVRLNGVTLIPDTLSLIGTVDTVERMSYFVPSTATTGILQLTGFGLIATDSTPITVLTHELFEPNDLAPTVVQLDTAHPYPPIPEEGVPGHPEIHFFEPALLYEPPTVADSITTDWFHFVSAAATAEPWTFVYHSPAIPRRGAFGVPATLISGVPVFAAGAFGFDFDAHHLLSRCRGSDFEFPVSGTVDSVSLSLQTLPASGIDFVEYTSNAGSYGLGVYTGYRTPDNGVSANVIAPDKFEDNDFCEQADANFLIDSLKVDMGAGPLSDTLTIDTPFEVDWLRFHVAAGGTVDIATAARNGFPDAALNLYLYRQSDLNPVDSVVGGSTAAAALSESLSAGDYYLVVVNTDGQPTRYGLCIAEGVACTQRPDPTPARSRGPRR